MRAARPLQTPLPPPPLLRLNRPPREKPERRESEMQRTCAGCREVGAPDDLVRAVLGPSGEAFPDFSGGGFGRGMWVHPRVECLAKALPRGFSKSMKTAVQTSPEEFVSLLRA